MLLSSGHLGGCWKCSQERDKKKAFGILIRRFLENGKFQDKEEGTCFSTATMVSRTSLIVTFIRTCLVGQWFTV